MKAPVYLCTQLGMAANSNEQAVVNRTLTWLDWHKDITEGVYLHLDNVPERVGQELQARSPVAVHLVRHPGKWVNARGPVGLVRDRKSVV